jgi:hypothetical protein
MDFAMLIFLKVCKNRTFCLTGKVYVPLLLKNFYQIKDKKLDKKFSCILKMNC